MFMFVSSECYHGMICGMYVVYMYRQYRPSTFVARKQTLRNLDLGPTVVLL